MKRRFISLFVCALPFLFSSCAVHVNGATVMMPWQMVTLLSVIPSLLIIVTVVWLTTAENRKALYVCPHCHHRFKPGWRVVFAPHVMDEYALTCPHCGKRDWCSMSYDQD